jgi:carbon storage regulator CsrA
MLVIARRTGQAVILKQDGKPDIRVHFLSHDRGVLRLGVDAPQSVTILREEVADRRGARHESKSNAPA